MNKKGFTLIEVMAALAILSLIFVQIFTFTSITRKLESRDEGRSEVYQVARVAMGRIVSDLDMAFLTGNQALLGKTSDGTNVETAFIGEDKGAGDSLDFDTFSHWRMVWGAKESDQAEVGYFVKPDPKDSDLNILMRREGNVLDSDVTKGGDEYPIATGVKEFQLRYYDNVAHEWRNDWNTKGMEIKNKLPEAVEITLVFADPVKEDEVLAFKTIAMIPMWKDEINF